MAWFLLPSSQFPLAPLAVPLLPPFVPLSTYLAPSSCDRNCPPPSQVACKLTLFAPPFTQLSHPSQISRAPTIQRLTTTTLGLLRSCYAEHSPPNVAVVGRMLVHGRIINALRPIRCDAPLVRVMLCLTS